MTKKHAADRLFQVCTLSLFVSSLSVAVARGEGKLEYNRDIRPILAENCFACHGPDSAARKAGLRLDQREAAIEARRSCPAIRTRATWSPHPSHDTDEA